MIDRAANLSDGLIGKNAARMIEGLNERTIDQSNNKYRSKELLG